MTVSADAVAIFGIGGLGHVAIKIAHAMGAHVVLFTTSPGKAEDARRLGADEVVISKNAAARHFAPSRREYSV